MIGTTAALIGLTAASAAGKVVGGAMQSRAAGKAAETQQKGADKAADYQKQMWGQQQQLMDPYRKTGGQSNALLGSLMLPPGAPGAYRPGMDFRPQPPMSSATTMPRAAGLVNGAPRPPAVYNRVPRVGMPDPDPRIWGR